MYESKTQQKIPAVDNLFNKFLRLSLIVASSLDIKDVKHFLSTSFSSLGLQFSNSFDSLSPTMILSSGTVFKKVLISSKGLKPHKASNSPKAIASSGL